MERAASKQLFFVGNLVFFQKNLSRSSNTCSFLRCRPSKLRPAMMVRTSSRERVMENKEKLFLSQFESKF